MLNLLAVLCIFILFGLAAYAKLVDQEEEWTEAVWVARCRCGWQGTQTNREAAYVEMYVHLDGRDPSQSYFHAWQSVDRVDV